MTMRKKVFALMLALVMVVTLLPATAFAAAAGPEPVTDFVQLQTAIADASGGTKEEPVEIKVSGEIECTGGFTLSSGKHIKLVGEGDGATLKRGDTNNSAVLFTLKGGTGDEPDCSLTLENIEIDGNNGTGNLIRVDNGGAVTIGNGTVLTNNAITVIYVSAQRGYTSTCTINGGEISGNTIEAYKSSSVITLNASGSYEDLPSGKLWFTMNDGEIKENSAYQATIRDEGTGDSTITIAGGKIHDNTVNGTDSIQGCGGAIYGNRKVVITGGEIYNNHADKFGGAIYNPMGSNTDKDGGTSLTITGGKIYNNTAGIKGDGIDANTLGGPFIVGGSAQIEGIYLRSGSKLSIKSALTDKIELECENPTPYSNMNGPTLVAVPYDGYTITQDDISKLEYKDGEYGFDFRSGSTTDVVITLPFCNINYDLTYLSKTEDSATRGNYSLGGEFYGYITVEEGYVLPPLSAVTVTKDGEPADPSHYAKGFDAEGRLKITFKSGLFAEPGDVTVTAAGIPEDEAVTDPVAMNVEQKKYYTSVDAALGAVEEGQTVRLLKDAEFEGLTVEFSFTLDLNGCILTADKSGRDGYAFNVTKLGGNVSLTIMDSSPMTAHASIHESISNVPEGAEITGGIITNKSGGGIRAQAGGTLVLESGSIAGCAGSGVYLNGGGSLEMNGGFIQYNKKSGDGGGISYSGSGTVNIFGGSIAHNKATNGGGGGIYVVGSKPVVMTGGSIFDNTAANGGGVYHDTGTSFTVSGDAKIVGNTATSDGGGVFVRDAFTMNGGEISGNTATRNGGGVYVYGGTRTIGSFKMTGGKVTENVAGVGGGGITLSKSSSSTVTNSVIIEYGEISRNTATYGAGIYQTAGTVTMSGGSISENAAGATGGGGVYVFNSGTTFTMTGGDITGNSSKAIGGGVVVDSGSFELTGGTITGNTASTNGGGVYVRNSGTVSLSGAPVISDNTGSGIGAGNLYINGIASSIGENLITLTGALTDGADIRLYAVQEKDGFVLVKAGEEYTITDDDLGKFTYDGLNYTLALDEGGKIILKEVEMIVDTPVVDFDNEDAHDTEFTADSFNSTTNSVLTPEVLTELRDTVGEDYTSPDGLGYIHVETKLDIKVTGYEHNSGEGQTNDVLTLEITPKYQVVATNSADKPTGTESDTEKVLSKELEGADENGWIEMEIHRPVTVTVPLPAEFAGDGATVYIKHTKEDGKVHWYTGSVKDDAVTFTNPDGFSTFEIRNTTTAQAEIGDTLYDTLQDALDHVQDGETIEVLTDEALTATAPAKELSFDIVAGEGVDDIDVTVNDNGNYHVTQDGSTYTVKYVAPVSPSRPAETTAKVEETEGGTVTLSSTTAKAGETVTATLTPDEGMKADGLTVTDADGSEVAVTENEDGTYSFVMPAATPVTVKGAFVEDCPADLFPDIDVTEWYHDYADYVIDNGIMNGYEDGTFKPHDVLTRAELATVLWNLSGQKDAGEDVLTFTDVAENDWFYAAVQWASGEGIVNGYEDGSFKPDQAVTREELAVMLYRYAESIGEEADPEYTIPATYTDVADIGDWALEAMSWCVQNGIINGRTATTIEPGATAERCEVAAMLTRYLRPAE